VPDPVTPLSPLPVPTSAPAASLILVGFPEYPDLCASCGVPAQARLTIEKVFEVNSSDDTPRGYVVDEVSIPFCPTCIATHDREVGRTTPLARMLLCFRSAMMISALGAVFFAGLLANAALGSMYRDMTSVVVLGGLSALCVLAAVGCTRSAYSETRRFAVPAQTSVTRRFDFSDDLSQQFDLPRRRYTALNPAFGEAFRALNRDRVWDPSSPQAIRASRHRGIVMAILLIVMIIVAFHKELKRLVGW
jgi:hypothetical protein